LYTLAGRANNVQACPAYDAAAMVRSPLEITTARAGTSNGERLDVDRDGSAYTRPVTPPGGPRGYLLQPGADEGVDDLALKHDVEDEDWQRGDGRCGHQGPPEVALLGQEHLQAYLDDHVIDFASHEQGPEVFVPGGDEEQDRQRRQRSAEVRH